MYKQEAIRVLRKKAEELQLSSEVTLDAGKTSGFNPSDGSPEFQEAVRLLADKRHFGFSKYPPVPVHMEDQERFKCYLEFEEDLEMVCLCSLDIWGQDLKYSRIKEIILIQSIGQRQAHLKDQKPNIPVALKIHKDHRHLLPAKAGIVDVEGEYVIVVPWIDYRDIIALNKYGTNTLTLYNSGATKKYEALRKKVLELQNVFMDNWAMDTVLVHLIPTETSGESRSSKTSYFHKVFASNSVTGYSEYIVEIKGQRGYEKGIETHLSFVTHNPNSKDPAELRQELKLVMNPECPMDYAEVLRQMGVFVEGLRDKVFWIG